MRNASLLFSCSQFFFKRVGFLGWGRYVLELMGEEQNNSMYWYLGHLMSESNGTDLQVCSEYKMQYVT